MRTLKDVLEKYFLETGSGAVAALSLESGLSIDLIRRAKRGARVKPSTALALAKAAQCSPAEAKEIAKSMATQRTKEAAS